MDFVTPTARILLILGCISVASAAASEKVTGDVKHRNGSPVNHCLIAIIEEPPSIQLIPTASHRVASALTNARGEFEIRLLGSVARRRAKVVAIGVPKKVRRSSSTIEITGTDVAVDYIGSRIRYHVLVPDTFVPSPTAAVGPITAR